MRNHLAPALLQKKRFPSNPSSHPSRVLCEETPLSSALRSAVQVEAHFRSSRGFDDQFWTRLDERRGRNATFKGRTQQLLETELSGIAVWRVLGSGTLGAVFPALLVVFCMGTSSPPANRAPLPVMGTVTPWNQRRFWEELAWKNPTKPVLVTLLDPNWKGGETCGYHFAGVIAFALVWAVLWVVPAFRWQNIRGVYPLDHPETSLYWEGLDSTQNRVVSALHDSPNDAFLQSQNLQANMGLATAQGIDSFFHDYDVLLAQHPRDVALWRNRLRLSTRGSLVSPNYLSPLAQGPASRFHEAVWLNSKDIEKVVVQARAAQKVDSDEAFFPWVEAMALWGLGREQESVKALEKAGRCSHFNEGAFDEVRGKITLINRFQPVEWDDKIGQMWATLFPHLAGMRGLTREIAYSGTRYFQAGNKSEAWRRWEVALGAGRAFRRSQSSGANASRIGLLVGEAIEGVTWEIAARGAGHYHLTPRPGGGSIRSESLRRAEESLRVFVRAARRDGHPQLAQWVAQDGQEIAARRASPRYGGNWLEILDRQLGWRTPIARATLQLRWVGAHAMLWALVGISAWLFSLLISRGGRNARIATGTVIQLSAFLGILWLGTAVLSVMDNAGATRYAAILAFGGEETSLPSLGWRSDWDWNFWWGVGATFLLAVVGREWGARRAALSDQATRDKTRLPHLPFWKTVGIAAWILSLVLSLCLWFDGANGRKFDGMEAVLWLCWVVSLALGLATARHNQKSDGVKAQRTVGFALVTALALTVFVLSGAAQYSDAAAGVALALCPMTLVLWIWSGLRGFWSGERIATNLETGARVLANVSLIIAVGYLGASLALWPARQQLNARVDSYVQMGEVNWSNSQTK